MSKLTLKGMGWALVFSVFLFSFLAVTPKISSKVTSFVFQKDIKCVRKASAVWAELTDCYDAKLIKNIDTIGIPKTIPDIWYLSLLATILEWIYFILILLIVFSIYKKYKLSKK